MPVAPVLTDPTEDLTPLVESGSSAFALPPMSSEVGQLPAVPQDSMRNRAERPTDDRSNFYSSAPRSDRDPDFFAARFSLRRSLSVLCGFFFSWCLGLSALLPTANLLRWSTLPRHDDMPASIRGRTDDDPLAVAPPQGVSDLRNLLPGSQLPCLVRIANGDER